MKKRILSLCMALALCLGLLPVTALAADGPTTLMVGGTSVIDSTDATTPTYWLNDGSGGIAETVNEETADKDNYNVKYDGSGTLTLNGAEIKKTHTYSYGIIYIHEYACGIFADGDLTIQLEGENTIDISSADAGAAGICILDSGLTIQGGGSLSVNATAAGTGGWTCNGIYAYSPSSSTTPVSITIQDSARVTATAAGAGLCNGIYAFSPSSSTTPVSIAIQDTAQVTATAAGAGQCSGIYAYAPSSGPNNPKSASLTIEGQVRVIADARRTGTEGPNSRGISVSADYEKASLTIQGGARVEANATGNGLNQGIALSTGYNEATGSLSIAGSTVDVQVSSTGSSAYGIVAANFRSNKVTVSIKDSAVTVRAEGATNAKGIEVGNDSSDEPSLSITNSTVDVCGAAGTGDGAGISVYRRKATDANEVSITDSTVTARGASTSGPGRGICTDDGTQPLDLTVSGSLLRATGVGAEGSGSICGSDESTDTRTDSIVFENAAGTVSGQAVLPEDLTVARGETLTVPAGAELTVPADKTLTVAEGGTLINEGTIVNNGQIIVWGTFINHGKLQGNPPIYKVTGVAVTPEDLALTVGGRATLTATVAPENATDQNVTWASSNSGVATVDAYGTVTAVGAGTATLTATAADGSGRSASCTVTVEPAPVVNSDPTYSVILPDNVEGGTVTANKRYAQAGETFRFTVTPDEGYQLDSLTVTDSKGSELALTDEGGGKYSFKMPARRVVVEAVFTVILPDYAACDHGPDCPLYGFTDLNGNAWYHDGIHFCLEEGVMAGYGNDLFGPDDALSRAQLCQIVYNMESQPAVTGGSAFTDVADGAWYLDAVTWAASQGIVGGYGGGLFGPEDNITREQLATILYRYAQAKGYDVSVGEDTNILSYTDVADLAEYAIPAMQWACGAGVINGTGDGSTLTPQGNATRAQIATMLMRFCEEYVTW